ncbi:DUF2811 domain-containing protein [Cyanobium sp. Morenito 9A2]|uniref:DUF2811 domain-containing protein n=1 Tax=Cyanobium sp. Morenito 9A2 TaxID=2823718 RepID=UPI0020CB7CAF|nr:DUF2811 domain-containing protein [Cyanobium sp. Morenito 9A2]MCP9850071.1 DUF2811 domain-containing protein [Cyanobium sp. Morenito 9A2]
MASPATTCSADNASGRWGLEIELPVDLLDAMQSFLRRRPGLEVDQLLQIALAQFLVQQGVAQPEVRELYLEGLFIMP